MARATHTKAPLREELLKDIQECIDSVREPLEATCIVQHILSIFEEVSRVLKTVDKVEKCVTVSTEAAWFVTPGRKDLTYAVFRLEAMLPAFLDLVRCNRFLSERERNDTHDLKKTKWLARMKSKKTSKKIVDDELLKLDRRAVMLALVDMSQLIIGLPYSYHRIQQFAEDLHEVATPILKELELKWRTSHNFDLSVIVKNDTATMIENIRGIDKNLGGLKNSFHKYFKKKQKGNILQESCAALLELIKDAVKFSLKFEEDQENFFVLLKRRTSLVQDIHVLTMKVIAYSNVSPAFYESEPKDYYAALEEEEKDAGLRGESKTYIEFIPYSDMTVGKYNVIEMNYVIYTNSLRGTCFIALETGIGFTYQCPPATTLREWIDETARKVGSSDKIKIINYLFEHVLEYNRLKGPIGSLCPENIRIAISRSNQLNFYFPSQLNLICSEKEITAPFITKSRLRVLKEKQNLPTDVPVIRNLFEEKIEICRYLPPEFFTPEDIATTSSFEVRSFSSNIYSFGAMAEEIYFGNTSQGRHYPYTEMPHELKAKKTSEIEDRKNFMELLKELIKQYRKASGSAKKKIMGQLRVIEYDDSILPKTIDLNQESINHEYMRAQKTVEIEDRQNFTELQKELFQVYKKASRHNKKKILRHLRVIEYDDDYLGKPVIEELEQEYINDEYMTRAIDSCCHPNPCRRTTDSNTLSTILSGRHDPEGQGE